MTTPTKIRKLIETAHENTALAERVEAALAPFDGKKITKRMATVLEKALPECSVYYDTNYGMYHVNVSWGTDEEKRFLLGYHGTPIFTVEGFAEHNACHLTAATKRNEERATFLNKAWLTKVADCIEKANKATASLKMLLEDCPESISIERLVNHGWAR